MKRKNTVRRRKNIALPWYKSSRCLQVVFFILCSLSVLLLIFIGNTMLHLDYFKLRTVHVQGTAPEVDRALFDKVLRDNLHGNFFSVSLGPLHRSLVRVPWVDVIAIKREWPNALQVTVTQKQVLARWGDDAFVTKDGSVIAQSSALASKDFIPSLLGPEGSINKVYITYEHLDEKLKILDLQMSKLQLTASGQWRAVLTNGLVLQLGANDIGRRLSSFVQLYPQLAQENKGNISLVDLRYPNGFAVRWK
jgi:cell division protein FtsQ